VLSILDEQIGIPLRPVPRRDEERAAGSDVSIGPVQLSVVGGPEEVDWPQAPVRLHLQVDDSVRERARRTVTGTDGGGDATVASRDEDAARAVRGETAARLPHAAAGRRISSFGGPQGC